MRYRHRDELQQHRQEQWEQQGEQWHGHKGDSKRDVRSIRNNRGVRVQLTSCRSDGRLWDNHIRNEHS